MAATYIGAAAGSIASSGNTGWFQVQLTAGTQYVFDVGNGTLTDPQVTLYDSSGNPLTSGVVNTSFNNESETSFTATTSGTYYIGASSVSSNTGSYYVQESTVPYDHAGNTTTNGTLAVGAPASGTIVTTGQSDWFKVQLTAGTDYVFTLGSGTLGNATLKFYDSNGNAIATNNLDGSTVASLEPATSGTYYVGVSSLSSATGTFSVSESTAAFNYANNIQTTGVVTVGGPVVADSLTTPGQSEWFKVQLTANTQYVFDVTGSGSLTLPTVALYNSSGASLVTQTLNGGPGAIDSRISYTPTTSGSYFVEASSLFAETGAFTVGVTTGPNGAIGNINTTASVAVGGSATGTIAVAGEADWYKVQLNANTEYVFDVGHGTLVGTGVTLYDSHGNQLVVGSSANGTAETSFDPATAGTYYVAASGQASDLGSYTVSVATAAVAVAGNINTTASLAIGGQASGSIAHSGESSWYKVQLTAGTAYAFNVGGGTLTNPEVVVYDSTGHQLVTGTSGGPSHGAQTFFDPSTSGTYFVAAESQGSAIGTFTVSVAAPSIGQLHAPEAPVVAAQETQQTVTAGQPVDFTLPANSFTDPNGFSLTYAATQSSGQALPTWLSFNAQTLEFTGTAPSSLQGSLTLEVTATDTAGLSTSETFAVTVPSINVVNSTGVQTTLVAPLANSTVQGAGYDVLDLSQNPIATTSSSYTITSNGDGSITVATSGSSDHVSGVEQLVFSDRTITVTPHNSFDEYAALLYQGSLGRTPDSAGLMTWETISNALPASVQALGVYGLSDASGNYNGTLSVAGGFTNSAEFTAKYGSLTNAQFVTQLYTNVLDRAPDTAGYNSWITALTPVSQGGLGETREHVLVGFAESAEAISNATQGFTGQSGTHAAWLFLS
jgi:hypothetical protein